MSYSPLGHVWGLFSLTKGWEVNFKKIGLCNLLMLSPHILEDFSTIGSLRVLVSVFGTK